MIDMSEQASALMKALGENFGLELQTDNAGACAMRIDDRVDVTLRYEPNPPSLLAYAPIGELPHEGVEGVLRGLLEANHVWDGSRGATWSLSADEVVLSRLFPLEGLEVDPLAADLAVFVDIALAGQQLLLAGASAAGGQPLQAGGTMSAATATDARFAAGDLPFAVGSMLPRGVIAP
jgi:Tir chaperone protein (CesT) family